MADTDDLAQGRAKFKLAQDAETTNRSTFEEDISFARHEEQWPNDIAKARTAERRPMLTISKMNAFIRQVVNDARQNKPSIKVHPADSGADPDTAEVINGLIRNIEYTSNADVAYDTAMECAVSGGFGYWRVTTDYAYHDTFDMDLRIERVANPLSVYGDPYSTAADSSDWMDAFVVDLYSKDAFEAKWGKTKTVQDWDDASWGEEGWREGNDVTVAEWWHRVEDEIKVSQFLNQVTGALQSYSEETIGKSDDIQMGLAAGLLQFKRDRMAKIMRVTQTTMTGAEVLGEVVKWAGCYIPIIPVYGDEYNIKGKRYFRSLIHSAKDAQRQFNYWRTTATELVALAPRVPYLVASGSVDDDIDRWNTANTESHAFLEYKGPIAPQRQPLDSGVAAGALQEALNASDDMKAVMGIYDASLGARSNETSGKAIMARQREGDVSTFHFTDNLNRAIRHTGRILIDLIPHVYSGERVIRVMGEDGRPQNVPLGKEYEKTDPKTGQPEIDETGQAVMAMHDLSSGKYDLTVKAGPSYTTQRAEIAENMAQLIQAYPPAAPILGPEMIRNQDWPGSDKAADKLDQQANGQIPPELQQAIEEGKQQIAQLTEENQQLKMDRSIDQEKLQADIEAEKAKADAEFQIEQIRIASQERIANAKIDSEMRIAEHKARLQAQVEANRPEPKRAA